MLSNILKNRRLRMGSFATVLTVIFIAVLIILNMIVSAISERYPIQLDLTTGKIYGLSDETIEYLKTVEKDVNIYLLATEDSFGSPNEYNSKIKVQFIDLAKDPAFESKYASYSMGSRDILLECGNKVQVVKTSDLFNLQNDSSTGYTYIKSSRTDEAITSAIMNVTSDYTPKVAILSAHSSFDAGAFSSLLSQNNFEVVTQDLLLEDIDPEAAAVVLFAPSEDLDEAQLDKLDAFLDNDGQKGKTLLYFAAANQPQLPNLEAFLSEWGIVMEDATVYETNFNRIYNYSPYYSIVDFVNTEIYEDTSAYLLMPNARVMDTAYTERDSRIVEVLLKFGSTAKALPNDAAEDFDIESAETYAFPALIKSTLQKSSGNANATGSALLESHVIVSSSAMSCESSLLSGSTFVNGKYYISLLNSLLGRESNFSITAKTLDTTTLTMTNFQILSIGAVFAIIIPLALLVVGVVVWLRRRHI